MTDKLYTHEDITRMVHTAFNEDGGLRDEIKSDIKSEILREVMDMEDRVLVKIVSLAV